MIKTTPSQTDIDQYTEQQEEKDTKRFDKLIKDLTNAEFAVLFSMVVGEYSQINLIEALDLTLDNDIKEELGDLWTFRRSNGLGA